MYIFLQLKVNQMCVLHILVMTDDCFDALYAYYASAMKRLRRVIFSPRPFFYVCCFRPACLLYFCSFPTWAQSIDSPQIVIHDAFVPVSLPPKTACCMLQTTNPFVFLEGRRREGKNYHSFLLRGAGKLRAHLDKVTQPYCMISFTRMTI